MIHHHPGDDLLLALAAGRLASGPALLVSVHVEGCAQCQGRTRSLQAIGGNLLDTMEPEALAPDALERTLQRIDARDIGRPPVMQAEVTRPALPEGIVWPASMRACAVSRWRRLGPGMHWSNVDLRHDFDGTLYLLRVAPGRSLARHTHVGVEMTQVLCGEFDDGLATFSAGDFDTADGNIRHQPVVQPGSECICLAYVERRLRFDGLVVTAIGRLIGM